MVRDRWMRILFIPLLGLLIPYLSGCVTYTLYRFPTLVAVHLYFFMVSFSIWSGCHWLHRKLRRLYNARGNPYHNILAVSLITCIYGSAIAALLYVSWVGFSRETFSVLVLLKFVVLSTCAVVIFTLLYEVLYLSKEREQDLFKVDQLDKEKALAEMQALRNELDPHFVFNALTTLLYLIRTNPAKAERFDLTLAQVFRYFLTHKNQGLVAVEKELAFIEAYFFLLQIRHDQMLQLKIIGRPPAVGFLVPCSLQLLVENAIKHNAFSAKKPLVIWITLSDQSISVRNALQPKEQVSPSTGIGLTNLNHQYLLLCHQAITIEATGEMFSVTVPIRPSTGPGSF